MRRTSFFRNLFTALLLAVGLGQPARLQAQLDPRLQTTASDSDVLDVYRSGGAKPEMLTIFDFSGSMHAVYWHPNYYTDYLESNHNNGWGLGSGDWFGLVPVFDSNTGNLYIVEGTGYYQHTTGGVPVSILNNGSAQLVSPDGNVVVIPPGTTSQAGLEQYVRMASHIRVTASATIGASTVTRTIDLPIPWAIFTPMSSNNAYSTITFIPDPKGGPSVDPDELYQSGNPDNILNNMDWQGYYKIGRLHYNYDFLWWVFFGMDKKDPVTGTVTNTGRFVIPAVTTNTPALEPTSYPAKSWRNTLQGFTRFQALKATAVQAWLANQDKVWWGYRFIDQNEDASGNAVSADNGNAASTVVSRDVRLFRTAQNASSMDTQLKHFLQLDPSTSTPLTYALANSYTQLAFTKDASSSFGTSSGGGQSGTESPIPACRKSFVVVFTDGQANDQLDASGTSAIGTGSDIYGQYPNATDSTTQLNLAGGLSQLTPGPFNRFNIWTLAGVAAHYPPPIGWVGPGSAVTSYTVSSVAPFNVTSRGATPANKRQIRTMTVGMSLGGLRTDPTSPKADLFRAALYGNPNVGSWDPNTKPFDPNDPTANDSNVNPFFFDASSVNALVAAMNTIISEVTAASASISAPSSPLVGLNLGRQAYLGIFKTATRGPVWQGDLLMAGVKVGNTGITFLDNSGAATTSITASNANWSAAARLQSSARYWDRRNLWTLKPGSSIPIPLDETHLTAADIGAPDAATAVQWIRWLRGANASDVSNPAAMAAWATGNRPDVMGDIINSSPITLAYPLSMYASSPVLAAGNYTGWTDMHFRVIYVGDNQGLFHAFGEVSGFKDVSVTTTDPVTGLPVTTTTKVAQGVVDELWAFLPGDFLKFIGYLKNTSNAHRYMTDGSPTAYFLDVPAAGQTAGNGIVDGSDVARVIIGLKKGGRSYYAFDVKNPFAQAPATPPTLSWSLQPDSSADPFLQHMGLSTATPAITRVDTGASNVTKDLVFLGGGLSDDQLDANAVAAAPGGFAYPAGTKLGRELLALDVQTGAIYQKFDLMALAGANPALTNIGPIAYNLSPLEFFTGSGKTQRIYFSDQPTPSQVTMAGGRGSGIFVLGDAKKNASGIRMDSSNIDNWTDTGASGGKPGFRKVFQAQAGENISYPPTSFLLDKPYPIRRTAAPTISPAVVGLLFATGDRNDPLDRDAINPTTTDFQNELYMIFDRQDSAILSGNTPSPTNGASVDTLGLVDADVYDLTNVSTLTDTRIDPTNVAYYLNTKFGYSLHLGARVAKAAGNPLNGLSPYYYPKGIIQPKVLAGALFFSVFTGSDSSGSCQGAGNTNTYRMCNVMAPVFNSGAGAASSSFDPTSTTCNGIVFTFQNLPSDITALGTTGVLQTGQSSETGGIGATGKGGQGHTDLFGFRPRTWRIIR